MHARTLLLRSLTYYWRTNLAVFLGVVAATAVIGGALVVGDSVRESLRRMTLDRLGQIDHVIDGQRFFREQIAADLAAAPEFSREYAAAAPAIHLSCSLQHSLSDGEIARAGQVQLYALDSRAWDLTEHGDVAPPQKDELVLSRRTADQLGVKSGDSVTMWVELPAAIPRDSLLGKRDQTSTQVPLVVRTILDDALGVARLGLRPNQQLPANAFVALDTVQSALGVNRSRRDPEGVPARVNTLFVSSRHESARGPEGAKSLDQLLKGVLKPIDADLRVVPDEKYGYLSVESTRMILEQSVAETAELVAAEQRWSISPVLVYLANEISTAHSGKSYTMYSVVAGVDLSSKPPFGPYEFQGETPRLPLGPKDIVLNDWAARDLHAELGDTVRLKYYTVGSHGELPEETREFRLAGIVKLDDTRAADRGLTPEVKGITDANSLDDWEQPFAMKFDRITDSDEDYWKKYRATPKAFISLARAQELWKSRYGQLTSLRIAPRQGTLADAEKFYTPLLIRALPLDRLGLAFQPVKFQGLQAASGTTDFGGLFVGFSFFLILSAAILVGLLFRLGVERRAADVGLLGAVGMTSRLTGRLLLGEAMLIVVVGAMLGSAAAVGYAWLMLYGLRTWWIGAIGTRFLFLSVTGQSLAIGFAISCIVAFLAVWGGTRMLRQISIRQLLAGVSSRTLSAEEQHRRGNWARRRAIACGVFAALLVVIAATGLLPQSQAFGGLSWTIVCFFVAGVLLLYTGLSFFSACLDVEHGTAVRGSGAMGTLRLGMRNAARARSRSTLTVGLIACATFVIVAVAAGQRNPARETPEFHSGNGGFTLVAESDQPILYDLNTADGRSKLNITADTPEQQRLLDEMKVIAFRMQPGDDASCLNIFQTRLPTILGAPQEMIDRGGFKFVGLAGNPWPMLNERTKDNRVPVFGDMNTLMYSMHKGVGQTVDVGDGQPPRDVLQIAGMFDGAVFQGVLVMSEQRFKEVFPEQAGYRYFLIEVPPHDGPALSHLLETKLEPFGFDAEPVAVRLRDFLAVQNTYLSTFQTLGGLGLLLGTFGLATVMLRNVLERRGELALLRAVGFRDGQLAWLVLCENAFLLVWGLVVGTVAALVAMMPHLLGIGADVPWNSCGVMLAGVFVVGMASGFAAVRAALRTPVLQSLRAE